MSIGYVMFILALDAENVINIENDCMEETPAYKSPVCTMPKPTDGPDDEYVSYGSPLGSATTAKREIDVVSKPRS